LIWIKTIPEPLSSGAQGLIRRGAQKCSQRTIKERRINALHNENQPRCMIIVRPFLQMNAYPLRHRTMMNVIGMARESRWQEEGWAIHATIEEFARLYSDFHRDAVDLIHAISPGMLFKWGLRDREPLQRYTKGRVTMLGDAAHPMTPFLGQGACVAIEDAMVLGRAFAAARTIGEAFSIYENTRKERANGVQLASREQANEIQGVTERGPNPGATADVRGLYLYNPVTVPLAPADEHCSSH
jgi:salicylate hydroxylase